MSVYMIFFILSMASFNQLHICTICRCAVLNGISFIRVVTSSTILHNHKNKKIKTTKKLPIVHPDICCQLQKATPLLTFDTRITRTVPK